MKGKSNPYYRRVEENFGVRVGTEESPSVIFERWDAGFCILFPHSDRYDNKVCLGMFFGRQNKENVYAFHFSFLKSFNFAQADGFG